MRLAGFVVVAAAVVTPVTPAALSQTPAPAYVTRNVGDNPFLFEFRGAASAVFTPPATG